MTLRPALVGVLVVLLAACTTTTGEPADDPPSPRSAAGAPTTARPPVPQAQALPQDWERVPWVGGRRTTAPGAATELPSILVDPRPARLVHHPTERWEDRDGWAGERLFFLGTDDRWRSLDLDDLGLPNGSWPGPDTYGAGSLSHDGRWWAGQAHAGVVLLDLRSGAVRYAALPPGRVHVAHVRWIPGRDVVSASAARGGSSRYDTFHVDTTGRVTPARYPGWRTTFDVDGTPVEATGVGRDRLRFTRWQGAQGAHAEARILTPGLELPRLMRRYVFPVLGPGEVALLAAARSWPALAPVQVWALDKRTGAITARLRVPATTDVVGWTEEGTLRLLLENRRLVEWHPRSGRVQRLLELPGPYPAPAEWAAATVAFPAG
ncbi:hypothetical protein GHK92_06430 [Nocardioides sp. dk4132]|uniref:hypothetical protein n=1 Tax=unclassified Nocardioides TaxID=2615069 RepID=UPI0012952C84|nr:MULTISPECIES: hypothetical protein [unclassified Nocardioides]MQW75503.1 hypothetical protein [Nocardioides sp. dk4132]QGA08418.1 hypothetical protein GFH29_14175 [Nocardioides sp. dk884]